MIRCSNTSRGRSTRSAAGLIATVRSCFCTAFRAPGTIPGTACQACLVPLLPAGISIRWATQPRSVQDFLGVWSADPDLPILSTMLKTQARIDPLRRYRSLALVAHSMGGLVVQRALIDDPELAERTDKVVLFGTPSAGLRKASWVVFWKRQLRNMAVGSGFITALRRDWSARFEPEPGFDLMVVAGERDRFVPPNSSLAPFPGHVRYVVPGDHLSMVRVADTGSPSVRLLMSALSDVPAPDESECSAGTGSRDTRCCSLGADRSTRRRDVSAGSRARGSFAGATRQA